MHIADANPNLLEIVGEIFRHALGQRRHEHALATALANADLVQQVVDLAAHGPNLDLRVDEAGRPDHLLDDDPLRQLELELARRRRREDRPWRER